jgi:hypothetical protein
MGDCVGREGLSGGKGWKGERGYDFMINCIL